MRINAIAATKPTLIPTIAPVEIPSAVVATMVLSHISPFHSYPSGQDIQEVELLSQTGVASSLSAQDIQVSFDE